MNKNTVLARTLLSLAIAGALGACSSSSNEPLEPGPPATPVSVTNAPAILQDESRLEEVMVTGSRVRDAGAAQDALQRQSALSSTGSRIVANAASPAYRMEPYYPGQRPNTENYAEITDNAIHLTSTEPVSTFSIDVDTGSYSNVRRFLNNGQLPPVDAVRTEELINYFSYAYPRTADEAPFSVMTEIATSPWHGGRHLLHIGIQAVEAEADAERNSNLVFLVDVSGSMASPDKLDLLKTALKLLSRQLTEADSIALVVYAGASGVVLEPTPGNETAAISAALDRLSAGGSTNGAAGIQLAYSLAQQHFIEGGINRVLLATDGDFNVGITDFAELKKLIGEKRKSGISLTTLGFGSGNYNDQLMEQLADAGNGNYAYIDNINEARKVLVDELDSTLQTVAKDVKIQIEFNPAVVSEYRLVGYENRMLAQQDFNNDKVDAGEIGAGHTVTALYEITLAGSAALSIDPLRYAAAAQTQQTTDSVFTNELAFLKLRYKAPDSDVSQLLQRPILTDDIVAELDSTSTEYRFSAAVAGFAQLLRDNDALSAFDYDDVLTLASSARGTDEFGYRSEFLNLVKTAQALD
jgi:Ca-activated chloride channel family protein